MSIRSGMARLAAAGSATSAMLRPMALVRSVQMRLTTAATGELTGMHLFSNNPTALYPPSLRPLIHGDRSLSTACLPTCFSFYRLSLALNLVAAFHVTPSPATYLFQATYYIVFSFYTLLTTSCRRMPLLNSGQTNLRVGSRSY